MSVSNLNGILAAYQYMNVLQKPVAGQGEAGFTNQLKNVANAALSLKADEYAEFLRSKFGANVIIQDVGKDRRSFDSLGANTTGYNNVVIAPDILERMAHDPKMADFYESKIQAGLDHFREVKAQLLASGFEIYSYGVCIHPDGTVSTFAFGNIISETGGKTEKEIEEETEAAQKEIMTRQEREKELNREAAEKRRIIAETQNQKYAMVETLYKRAPETAVNYFYAGEIVNASQVNKTKEAAVPSDPDGVSDDNVISSWEDMVDGSNTIVYKTNLTDQEQPFYIVKVWDASGNVKDRMVDVVSVSPKYCDTFEMYAYAAYLEESGDYDGALRKFLVAKAANQTDNINYTDQLDPVDGLSVKADWVNIVRNITRSYADMDHANKYAEWKSFLDFLE